MYNPKLCVGCRYCMMACPLRACLRLQQCLEPAGTSAPCALRAQAGPLLPGCVEACPKEALVFGRRAAIWSSFGSVGASWTIPACTKTTSAGEHEMGGTNWLYLAPVAYAELGQPDVPSVSAPELTHGVLGSIAVIAGVWPVILAARTHEQAYKKMVEQARCEGAQQAAGQGCANASADASADANAQGCGCKSADDNPQKGQGGGQC